MVEFYVIQPDQLKCLSIMLTVAGETLFSLYIRRRMITLLKLNPFLNFGMASKAFLV